jgi:hypothetical protein
MATNVMTDLKSYVEDEEYYDINEVESMVPACHGLQVFDTIEEFALFQHSWYCQAPLHLGAHPMLMWSLLI